jgi:hypothetical protein
MTIGGWGGWNYVIGSSMLLKNAGGEEIVIYCIFDSDYHTPDEIKERLKSATIHGVQMHIWARKEIENYLLVPKAIKRIISSSIAKGAASPNKDEIIEHIDKIAETLKDSTFDSMANEFLIQNRLGGATNANKLARERIDKAWKTHEGRLSIISGKSVISRLSDWSQSKYGVILSSHKIARELLISEIAPELVYVVKAIEDNQKF